MDKEISKDDMDDFYPCVDCIMGRDTEGCKQFIGDNGYTQNSVGCGKVPDET